MSPGVALAASCACGVSFGSVGVVRLRAWLVDTLRRIIAAAERQRAMRTATVPGRAACVSLLARALQGRAGRARPLAVLMLDCDRFKFINDAYGYAIGDGVLDAVAARIRRTMPSPHHMEWAGGDEFIVVAEGPTSRESALARAAALLDAFDEPLHVVGRPIYTSVSIGIALAPDHGVRPEALLVAAECALREAKRAGRQTARIYDVRVGARDARQGRALQQLHEAHAAGRLELHYQPKIDLSSGACTGFEALLRLRTPQGLEGPAALIDAAEHSGFISKLGEWVFSQASAQGRRWREEGIVAPIAVNLSAKQLQDARFKAFVEGQLAIDPALPRHLQLEITESALATDQLEFAGALKRLRELGFHIQIDDFGTGYSTMGFLARMSIDTLRIDRSFIAGLPEAQDCRKIVRAILAMAHDLKLHVVAEGIETLQQARWLRRLGCDQGQGFLFAQALPPEQASRFAHQGAPAGLLEGDPQSAEQISQSAFPRPEGSAPPCGQGAGPRAHAAKPPSG